MSTPVPPVPPTPTPQPKKPFYKKWWFIAIVVIILLVAIGQAMGGGSDTAGTQSTPAASVPATTDTAQSDAAAAPAATPEETSEAPAEETITLKATATGEGTVIWGDTDGSTNTESFSGSWEKTVTGEDAEKTYTLSVTGDVMGDDSQQMTCEILVNGESKDDASATGTMGSASCTTPLW